MDRGTDWCATAQRQSGVVSRRQLLSAGCTPEQIRAQLASGRWQAPWPGVYVTFTGPPPPHARLWVAILAAGRGAVAGPRSSLWLAGIERDPPSPLDVVIPLDRRARIAGGALPGVRRRGRLDQDSTSAGWLPPRLRLEEAVLDRLGDARRPAEVIDLVLRVVQQGFTTADRLARELDRRRAHRWRELIRELLAEVREGVRSPLERRWLRDVARPHGLRPAG